MEFNACHYTAIARLSRVILPLQSLTFLASHKKRNLVKAKLKTKDGFSVNLSSVICDMILHALSVLVMRNQPFTFPGGFC